jgi:hypothetical protein
MMTSVQIGNRVSLLKSSFLLIVTSIVFCFYVNAQTWDWVHAEPNGPVSYTGEDDAAHHLKTDASGNVYVLGSFLGYLYLNDNIVTQGNGSYLAKYDPQGTLLWYQIIGPDYANTSGDTYIKACDLVVNSEGIFITGRYNYSYGSADPSHNCNVSVGTSKAYKIGSYSFTSNIYDIGFFLAKLSFDGNVIWNKTATDSYYNEQTHCWQPANCSNCGTGVGYPVLTSDPNNNLTVAFSYYPSFFLGDADVVFAGTTIHSARTTGGSDVFVININSNGDYRWSNSAFTQPYFLGYGYVGSDLDCNSIAADNNGNIFITGLAGDHAVFGSDNVNTTPAGGALRYIAKLSSSGAWVFEKMLTKYSPISSLGSFGGYSMDANPNLLAADGDNNIYMLVNLQRLPVYEQQYILGTLVPDPAQSSIYLLKMSNNGSAIWVNQFARNYFQGANYAFGINYSNNDLYMTGSLASGRTGISYYQFGNLSVPSASTNNSSEYFVSRCDVDGNFKWATTFSGFSVSGFSVAVSGNNIYTAGLYRQKIYSLGNFNVDRSGTTDISTSEPFFGKINDKYIRIGAISPTTLCPGSNFIIPFTSYGLTFSNGNSFTAELSDANGDFTNAIAVGSTATTGSGSITATLPGNLPLNSSGYKVRIKSSDLLNTEYPYYAYADINYDITVGTQTFYQDLDNDGFGNPAVSSQTCSVQQGYVTDNSDCDDNDGAKYPGAPELCDGKDNNCDGQVDENCPIVQSPNIYTIAGNGIQGYGGDGGSATDAKLNEPFDAVVDAGGNIYIADQSDNRIRKITPAGIISTFAGTNLSGYNGDGGLAINARLSNPTGLAIDAVGNIYIADGGNQRIRKISPDGTITTVVGNGTSGYSGDGGQATNAQLNYPIRVALDAVGNIYISDWGNNVIRKVDVFGIISTIAGTGVNGYSGDGGLAINAQLNNPAGLAFDAQNNLYVALESGRVRKITPGGIISTVAGTSVRGYNGDGGLAINAQLNSPEGVAFDANGNLYIADNGGHRIRKVNPYGFISTFAGTGVAGFSGDGGPADQAQIYYPGSITVEGNGNFIVTDDYNHRVRLIGTLVPPVVLPPIITSFNPSSGAVNTSITITGENFNPTPSNNTVYFGAVKATVTSGTTNSLTVTLPAGATYQPISVLDNATGLTGYSTKPFSTTFTNPFGTGITSNYYKPAINLTGASYPFWTSIGDLDGDGKSDLVVANSATSSISVFRNTTAPGGISAASFAPPVNFSTGIDPVYVSISDLDGDGKPDIAVVNRGSSTVSVFHNTTTTGTINSNSFADKIDFATGAGPYSMDIADIDRDGKPELITANIDNNSVSVLRNICTTGSISVSSFSGKVDFAAGGGNPSIVKARDLDGDGKPEIVVANYTAYSVSVLQNISMRGTINASSFAEHFELSHGLTPFSVSIGDLDGDGKPEIAVTNLGSSSISVFHNTSNPGVLSPSNFTDKFEIPTGVYSPSMYISDADGDGKADLMIANQYSGTISVIRNTATPGNLSIASFTDKADFNTPGQAISIVAGDLDGDGITELVASNYGNSVSVYQVDKPLAGALNFDGQNDQVDLGTHFNYQNFTIELWVKPGSTQKTYADIIDNNHTDYQSWVLQQNGSNVNQYYFGGSTGTSPTFSLTPNVWQHIAIVSTSTTKTIYVNGVPVVTQTGLPAIIYNGTEHLRLGNWGLGGRNWNGSMDELRIWNRALCQSEIQHYMNNELPFSSGNGLISYYKMNTGFVNADNSQETSLVDETGSHNGTLNNFALTGASSNWIEGHVTGTASIFQNNPVTISFDGDGKLTCANPSVQLTASGTGAFLWSTGATTSSIFVTNPGDYTVTKTDAGGCSSSTTTSVLQDTTEPGISIFTPSTVFTCESPGIGNAIALWVWGNGTATVSNSNNILMDPYEVGAWSIGEPGTYTATITGANGCTSTQQITYTSNFNPPSITITNNSGTTLLSCSVSNISVTASGGRSYSWDGGNSPNTAENSFTLPGVYTVTVTGYNGCTATNSITILESQDVTPPTITCPTTITINTSPGLCTGTTTLTPPTVTDNCNSLGNALNFNGGYVNVPHSSLITPLNAWTIETWVRRTTTNTQESLIEKYSNAYGVYGYLLRIQGDYAVTSFLISSNFGYTLTGNTPLLPNVWYHLAATFNRASGEIKLYVNGVLDGQLTGLSGLPTDPGTQSLKIGARGDDADTRFSHGGLMDEVRIWNVERTQADILSSMNYELGAQPGLVALYHLNQGIAGGNNTGLTNVIDASGNGHDGSLIDFALTGPTSNWVGGKDFGLKLVNNAPATYPKGNTSVTWTATDGSGNSATCIQVVTVVDNQQPVITSPVTGNTNRNTNAGICTYKAVLTEFNATATDNCGVTSLTYQLTGVTTGTGTTLAGVVFNKGVTTVKWTASDGVTATVTSSFTVTVADNQQPVITCPVTGNTNRNTNAGVCTYKAALTEFNATATDNCAVTSLTYALTGATTGTGTTLTNAIFNKGITTVAWTASDGVNATVRCSFTVTVIDNEKPVITSCPIDSLKCYNANGTYTVAALTATDNCGVQSISYAVSGATSRSGNSNNASGVFNPGTSTIAWKVTDASGNTATCATIMKIDKVDAQIRDTFPANITASFGIPNTIYIGYGGSSITLTAQITSSVSPNSYTYKWTAGSPAGPAIATTQSLTVSPTTTTTYFVSIKDSYGCSQTMQLSKQVNVVDIRCGSGKIYVCKFKSGSYTTNCIQATTNNVNNLGAGSYLGQCVTTVTKATQTVIEEVRPIETFNVSAYPNPSTSSFNIIVRSQNQFEKIYLRIMNVNGQIVEKRNDVVPGEIIKIGQKYISGMYFVQVIQGDKNETVKLIKQ